MLTPFRSSGPVSRSTTLAVLAAALFSAGAAHAQNTNPQLLPYTIGTVAGGATASPVAGATCPVSGNKSTDAYGDGCLATEVLLGVPRFVTTDKNGVVFFADTNNGLIRRIDPSTGVITTVAGGASSSPGTGTACGVGISTSSHGDGCPATQVKLGKPEGLVFSAAGDLYFTDNSFDDVRKVAAIGGAITANSIITNIAGNITTFGYATNNGSGGGTINAATQSYLNFPYGLAFDPAGNLFIGDEGNQAISVINLQATTQTIMGQAVPAGTIAKVAGYGNLNTKVTGVECPNFTAAATGSRGGCYFGSWVDGSPALTSPTDNPFDVAFDATGNLYFANQFNYNIGKVSTAGIISNFAGKQGTKGTAITRGPAGSFGISNTFNVATDSNSNLYLSDGGNGLVWRVDAPSTAMYVVAGGATANCAAATNAFGDGCPATQVVLGKSSGSGASLLPGGAGGLNADIFGNLYITDTTNNTVRIVSSGTQFGSVGANQPTQLVALHFAAGDGPAATGAYTLTAGATLFGLGTATCTTNSDNTTDCLLPVTAKPATLGAFTGTLKVTSSLGKTSSFVLNGTYVSSRLTRTIVSLDTGTACAGSTTVSTSSPVTLTSTISSTGAPTGTITFSANGVQVGTPQAVTNIGTVAAPVYGAKLATTFPTAATYTITAVYSGDTNFNASNGQASTQVITAAPTFALTVLDNGASTLASQVCRAATCTINAGETALYAFTLAETVYNGSVSFACSGLPAYASCIFNPASISDAGCTQSSTVTLSVTTQQSLPIKAGSFAAMGRGPLAWLLLVPGIGLALLLGARRRRTPLGISLTLAALLIGATGLTACGKSNTAPATPSGTSVITVTATGSNGTTQTATVSMIVK